MPGNRLIGQSANVACQRPGPGATGILTGPDGAIVGLGGCLSFNPQLHTLSPGLHPDNGRNLACHVAESCRSYQCVLALSWSWHQGGSCEDPGSPRR